MAAFGDLCRAFLAQEYADSPVLASHLGVDGYDDRLDDLSEAAFAARRRRSAEWLARFEAVPDDGLGPEECIDRDNNNGWHHAAWSSLPSRTTVAGSEALR